MKIARILGRALLAGSVLFGTVLAGAILQGRSSAKASTALDFPAPHSLQSPAASGSFAQLDASNPPNPGNLEVNASENPDLAPVLLPEDPLEDLLSEDPLSEVLPSDRKDGMAQVTSVSQLSDVQPTDWAFQALQSLVERYGCIAGYPNGTFAGNRALSRYEFAAGLNACLDRISELLAAATADLATKEDLARLQKLQDDFAAELAVVRGRVDRLEARTAELEANQFSTTTKLVGESVFALGGVLIGDEVNGRDVQEIIAFGDRIRLDLETSFTGEDLLLTRLEATGFGPLSETSTFTPEGDLAFAEGTGNDVELGKLFYAFPLGEQTEVFIIANDGESEDFVETLNILDGDGGLGALSVFGTRNPIYYLSEGTGVGISHEFNDVLALSLGYLADDDSAGDPGESSGFLNGPYGAIGQLTLSPNEDLDIGFTYVHSYNAEMGAGSTRANFRSFTDDRLGLGSEVPIVSNSYGLEFSWRLSRKFVLGGWTGYTTTRTLSTLGGRLDRGDLSIWNWAVTLGFPDLLIPGNLGGIIVGMEPKVTGSSVDLGPFGLGDRDRDSSIHIEGFYQVRLNDNLAVTPGFIWLTAPDQDSRNGDIFIGTIRTTFSF